MEINKRNPLYFQYNGVLKFIMRTILLLFCTTVFALTPKEGISQRIKINEDKMVSVDEVFRIIRSQTKDYMFIYKADLFKDLPSVELKKGVIRMDRLINQSLSGGDLSVVVTENNTILIKKKAKRQQVQVSGLVTSKEGQPLVDVTVLVKGTTLGTATDFDGRYSITVPNLENVLVFSALGFVSQEITVGNRTALDVQLEQDVTQLGEVILNAGYYTIKERESTGSIEKVSAIDIEKQPISNPLAALQGRMAGVEIEQTSGLPGAKFNIRIRGQNSIRSEANEPLYIVDGVPYSSTSLGEGQASIPLVSGAISPLNNINPSDIESIEVLKDADATAIYGSRGANGVVLITTKKGGAQGTQVEINVLSGMGKVNHTIDLLGTADYLAMRREAYINEGVNEYPANAYDINGVWDQNRETDWQKVLFGKTSYLSNIQGSVSGGNTNTHFLLSGNYHEQTSIFPGDYKNNKVSFLANVGHISDNERLSIQLSNSFTINMNNLPGGGLLILNSLSFPPNSPELYQEDGSLNWENSTWTNPMVEFEKKYASNASTLISNLTMGYQIVNGLVIKANLGYTENHLSEILTTPSTIYNPVYEAGPEYSRSLFSQGKRTSWIIEPQLDFDKEIGSVRLGALVGLTFQEQKSEQFSQIGNGFTSNKLIEHQAAAHQLIPMSDLNQQYRYQAIYGRFNMGIKKKFFLNLTGRRDGSSRFGPDNRFGTFGAIGASWLISEEKFVRKIGSFLSYGKLRTSYGTSGSDQIGDYQYLDSYSIGTSSYQGVYGLSTSRLFNPDYGWEKNKKLEFALDLGFIQDRIFVSASFYKNRSSNQLVGIPLPGTTGFGSLNGNLGAIVENTGWELELNTVNIQSEGFNWTTSFNLTIPKNRLVAFPNLQESTYSNLLVVGEPLNITKLYKWNGVDPTTGLHTFQDFNEDGSLSAMDDQKITRDLNPQYFGGLINHLSYGKFKVDVFFQFTKQLGFSILSGRASPGLMANQPKEVLQRWQNAGDISAFQRFSSGSPDSNSSFQRFRESTGVVSDASFVRLKNISVSYQLMNRIDHGYSIDLFLRGQNLYTWTNYLGLDPETMNPQAAPSLRMVSIGTKLNF